MAERNQLRIFISAFAANPNYGSEFAVGWNIPYQIAVNSNHVVHLFIGTYEGSGFGKFDGLVEESLPKNLIIHKVHAGLVANLLNRLNSNFGLGFAFYFALKIWNIRVLAKARLVEHKYGSADITHHLGPIGFREPGFLHRLGRLHIWGPIGGAERIELGRIKKLNNYFVKSAIKNSINEFQLRSSRVSEAINNSNLLVFATKGNKNVFREYYKKIALDALVISESAMHVRVNIHRDIGDRNGDLICLFVGSLDHRKNILFLVDVFKDLPNTIKLFIVGDGPLRKKVEKTLIEFNLTNIEFIGPCSYLKVNEYYQKSDILLLPSLAEGNPNVVWESYSNGVPAMSFNVGGMVSSLENVGFLIDQKEYESSHRAWREQLISLQADRKPINEKLKYLDEFRRNNSWSNRASQFIKIYEEIAD